MKAEQIMQSDLLDIIFENKNKDYGAYALRKNYNSRLYKAMGIMAAGVSAFILLVSFTDKKEQEKPLLKTTVIELEKIYQKEIEKEKPKEEKKSEKAVKKLIKQESKTAPDITDKRVEDKDKVKKDDDLIGKIIGPIDVPDGTDDGTFVRPIDTRNLDTVASKGIIEKPAEKETILTYVQEMPQFPGGSEALKKFMLKHLRQPDDLEEGEKIVVRAQFVVNAEGEIVNVKISQNGRNDLDKEVLRVVNKMPKWKPGIQNGNKVSVYYSLPVTFISSAY